jgi:hypothetical protein
LESAANDQVLNLSLILNGLQRLGHDGPKNRTDQAAFPASTYRMFDASNITDYDRGFLTSHQYYRLSASVRSQIAADIAPQASPLVA